jgi:hypothetical protein
MDVVFTQYSLISNIFHYLNHCDLLTFGSCSRQVFDLAKFELNLKYPAPIWEINDYLISLSPSSKPKKIYRYGFVYNQDFFCGRKGVHVYYKSKKNKVHLYIHSIYGNYLKMLIHQNEDIDSDDDCLMDEVDSQHIFHFNKLEKTLLYFDSPLFPSSLVDISQINEPVIHKLVLNHSKKVHKTFAHACSRLNFYQDVTMLDFLYKDLGISTANSKFISTHASTYNYIAANHTLYQFKENRVRNTFDVDIFYLTEGWIFEDRFYVSREYLADHYYSYNIVDLSLGKRSEIALMGQYCYVGNSCLASLSDESKLKILDLTSLYLWESKEAFDGQPIGSVDGKYGLFLKNDNKIFRIKNILDKFSFTIINKR